MHIVCPTCDTRVPGWAVDLDHMTATCRVCGTMFDCTGSLPQRLRRYDAPKLPAGMSIQVVDNQPSTALGVYRSESPAIRGRMTIRLRRVPLRHSLALYVVALLWWAMTWEYLVGDGWTALGVIAVGVWLLLWALSETLRRTELVADASELVVRRVPLSLGESKRLRTAELRRIYSTELVSGTHDKGERSLYSVFAQTLDGRVVPLVEELFEPEAALVLVRRLNEHLGLHERDEP